MEAGCKIPRARMKTALAEHLTILSSFVSLGTPDMLTAFGTAMEIPIYPLPLVLSPLSYLLLCSHCQQLAITHCFVTIVTSRILLSYQYF